MKSSDIDNAKGPDIQKIAAYLFCIICALLVVYVIFKYLTGLFMPFLIAYAFAFLVNPIANAMKRKFSIKKRYCFIFMTATIMALTFICISYIVNTIISEGEKLIDFLAKDGANIGSAIADFINKLTSVGNSKVPLIESLMKIEQFRLFYENIDTVIANAISSYVESITKAIPRFLMNSLMKMPSIILFIIMTIISCFYFAIDFDRINIAIISILPKSVKNKIPKWKKIITGTFAKYARAYLLLLLLTFAELLVGFSILRINYPFLLAFTIALIDILPILGIGTAIIPWALIELLLLKNYYIGIGLLILYIIITIVRQITEPKIIAGSLGLHPLATLIAMYSGLKLFGILGMIIGPIILLCILSVMKKDNPPVDLQETI